MEKSAQATGLHIELEWWSDACIPILMKQAAPTGWCRLLFSFSRGGSLQSGRSGSCHHRGYISVCITDTLDAEILNQNAGNTW